MGRREVCSHRSPGSQRQEVLAAPAADLAARFFSPIQISTLSTGRPLFYGRQSRSFSRRPADPWGATRSSRPPSATYAARSDQDYPTPWRASRGDTVRSVIMSTLPPGPHSPGESPTRGGGPPLSVGARGEGRTLAFRPVQGRGPSPRTEQCGRSCSHVSALRSMYGVPGFQLRICSLFTCVHVACTIHSTERSGHGALRSLMFMSREQ